LTRILPITKFLVLRARERGKKRHHVIDFRLRQYQRLHVLVEPRVSYSITLVIMVHCVPQCLHRPVVEVRPGHKDVSQAGQRTFTMQAR